VRRSSPEGGREPLACQNPRSDIVEHHARAEEKYSIPEDVKVSSSSMSRRTAHGCKGVAPET